MPFVRLVAPILFLVLNFQALSASVAGNGVTAETVSYPVGELEFTGTLYSPASGESAPLLIVYHAANRGKSSDPIYDHLRNDLPAAGIATFLFDRRGSGNQPGDFETASFEDLAHDGLAALKVLKNDPRIDAGRIGTWGISQGGWIAPLAAVLSDDVSFAISVSGPGVTPAEQMAFAAEYQLRDEGYPKEIVERALELRAKVDAYYRNPVGREVLETELDRYRGEKWYRTAYLPSKPLPEDVTRSKWFQEMDFDPTKPLSKLDKPILVIFGAKDHLVPVQDSVDAIRAAFPNDTLLRVYVSEESGHLMSGKDKSTDYDGEDPVETRYLEVMIEWIDSLK